jgi:hypothetical protein
VFGSADEDRLFLEKVSTDLVRVIYQPSASKLELSEEYAPPEAPEKAQRKLLELGGTTHYFRIYPLNTLPTHRNFLLPKYKRIESITLEGFDFEMPASAEDLPELLEGLPSGFVKDFGYGLGLVKDYRFIIYAIEEAPQIKHLVISWENDTAVSGECYILSFKDYDVIRRGINRITSTQQREGANDKWILAHNSLLTALDPKNFPERARPYKKDTIFKLISTESNATLRLSTADQNAAVRLIERNKKELAQKAPEQLLRFQKDIELVNLELLIAKYEDMIAKNLPEARWQALFNENPFILNLTFGYPVVKIQDQAHVGGQTVSGSGDTIADFLVKNGISNNAALVEIKTPAAPLLNRTPYRGNLYTPSSDLSGAINQLLDQKGEFQKDIARIKENSRIYNLETYAVHGVLVIGTTPEEVDQQKSFELFRGNSKDITIITFDELLAKLKLLHEFLLSHAPEARQAAALQRLETKLLRLQDQFQQLFEHTDSKSRSMRRSTSKPLPGVDGKTVMVTIGKLAILKQGFDRAHLQIPPYPVSINEATQRIVKAQTLEELITQAENVIVDAEAVLATQIRKR